ncbi:hypothetical protein BN129_3091 [Cronobacter sakazakii 701]|nr:hypothetical protein BN129_3091 [Cronobacter sakazakii 701]
MVRAERPGADKRQPANQQQRPDEQLAVLHFIGGPGDDNHGDGRSEIGHGGEPAHFHHAHVFAAAADDGWQPQHKAVNADAPCEILRAQQDNVARAEGFAVIAHRFNAFLLFIQLRLERRFLVIRQPLHLRRFILHQHPPAERPDNRRDAFDDEHFTPAERLNEIARDHRHPQHGGWVTENQKGVGARALRLRKPVADVNQHGGHDGGFHHAEDKADRRQHRDIADHAGQRRAAAPQNQADENEFTHAAALGVNRARDLEKEVAEEEQGAQQR